MSSEPPTKKPRRPSCSTKPREPLPPIPPPEHAWERQPHEGDAPWVAFVHYRDEGPAKRAHRRTAEALEYDLPVISKWSSHWEWIKRVRAYDSWVDRQVKLAEIEAIKDMRKRHVQIAMTLQGAAALALNRIVESERKGDKAQLRPSDVRDLIDLGTRLERITRGEPDGIVEERQVQDAESSAPKITHDFSKLSREDLRELKALIRKSKPPE